KGGELKTIGDSISIEKADAVTLFLSTATTFRYQDPEQVCLEQIETASLKTYPELKEAHITEYHEKIDRVHLELSSDEQEAVDMLPTDLRIKRYQEGEEDVALESLFFQYGRYLLISSSRPGSLPANLQGI